MSEFIDQAAAGNPAPAVELDGALDIDQGSAAADPATDSAAASSGEQADQAAPPASVRDFILKGLDEINPGETADAGEDGEGDLGSAAPDDAAAQTDKNAEPAETDPEPEAEAEEEAKPEEEEAEEAEATAKRTIPEIVSASEIDTKFNRTSKEIRDVAKQNGEAAEAYKALHAELGGDYLHESLKLVAKGFMEESTLPVFQGYLQANGVDSFTDLLEDAMKVALIESQKDEPQDEGARLFQQSCKDVTNAVLKARFGDNATIDHIAKLLKYDAEGHLNTADIDNFYGTEADGDDVEPSPDSKLGKALARIKELEGDKEPDEAAGKETAEREANRHSVSFDKNVRADREKILAESLFKKSVLKPLQSDPPELKAGKEKARKLLNDFAGNYQRSQAAYHRLREGDAKGNALTDSFKMKYSSLMDATVLATREVASDLEAVFNLVYALRRNRNLQTGDPKPENTETTEANGEPTQTKAKEKPAARTREQHRAYLAEQLSGAQQ